MYFKSTPVLLLIVSTLTFKGQSSMDMPHLKRVFASLEQNFTPVIGKLNESKLPDSVYTSLVQIEETEENEIYKFSTGNYSYFATLGSGVKSKDRIIHLLNKWKDRIALLATDYVLKSENLTEIAGTHLGYEFEKLRFGMHDYMIHLCFYKMKGTSKYAAYISLFNAQLPKTY